MTKNHKIILTFVLIFAVLGGFYLFIQSYEPAPPTPTAAPTPTIQLLSVDPAHIVQISIENEADTYAFLKDDEHWFLKDAPSIAVNESRVESLSFSAATLSANACITENAAQLADYGLDKPLALITLLLDSGESVSFKIGNLTPAGDGYYGSVGDSTAVYTLPISTGSLFCNPLSAYRFMTITALSAADIRSITITKENKPFRVVYVAPPDGVYPGAISTWKIETPILRDADNALVQEKLLTPLSALVATDIAADNPAALSEYGFSGDSVEIKTETETVRFSVGQTSAGTFVLPEGSSTVYFMGPAPLSFMEVTPFDILEKMTNLIAIDTVSSIDIRLPGASCTLDITHEGENMRFFVNDKEAAEEPFKAIYVELSALSVDGMITSSYTAGNTAPAATIVYTLTDGSAVTLAYYPYDDFNYAVFENGESTFYIKKTKLSALSEKLNTLIQNPRG